jgi:BlaI family transcriptional regulator, penicillinase repressor
MPDNGRRLDELEREVARAVKAVIGWLCNGSVAEVLVGMVGERTLDQETLQRLAERIEEAKEEKTDEKKQRRTEGKTSCWRSSFRPP